MNINYVKEYLKEHKDTITTEDVETLISEINTYQGTEANLTDISKVMRTINEYSITYLDKVQEYEALPKNKDIKLLPKAIDKVRDILCTLSALHTYLTFSVATIRDNTYNMKNIRSYITDLNDKKEHFKSEKMLWASLLRSFTQQLVFYTEMRKMDLQDMIGYTPDKSGYIKYYDEEK